MIIIDRIEGDFAVVETDSGMMDIPLSQLPEGSHEGDVLTCTDGVWSRDIKASEERRKAVAGKLRRLLSKDDD